MSKIKGRPGWPGIKPAARSTEDALSNQIERQLRSGWIGLLALLAAITMMFAAMTSTFVDRILQGNELHLTVPSALWFSTAVILLSSYLAERARAKAKKGQWLAARQHLLWTFGFGLAFVAGQWFSWGQLSQAGVFLQSNPHSSFFYLLTFLHAMHVLGGIGWLAAAQMYIRRLNPTLRLTHAEHEQVQMTGPERRVLNSISLSTTYWHYVGMLWLYLFVLLFAF